MVRWLSGQVNVKSQSELDIGGRETCLSILDACILVMVHDMYICILLMFFLNRVD